MISHDANDIITILLMSVCTCQVYSSSCLIHTCECRFLLLLSKIYDVSGLSLGCWLSRHKNLHIKFSLPQWHVHAPFIMYCSTLFVVFQERNCLHILLFVGSQSFISLPTFMFFSAAVSELCKSNLNKEEKKNSEIGYFLGI